LVVTLVVGSRCGFSKTPILAHNLTMTVTAAGMLWVGLVWFSFNGGSALAANGDASMAMLFTYISAVAGTLTWLATE
jgi:ammonia channel protein AmtB